MRGSFFGLSILLRAFRPFLAVLAFAFAVVLAPEAFPDHGLGRRAILDGDQARMETLLNRGLNPNSQRAVLSEICWYLGRLTSHTGGPDLSVQPPLLILAIEKDQPAIAQLLLDRGADPNLLSTNGTTALYHAVLRDDPALVRSLLAHGADPTVHMPDGSTALHDAHGRPLSHDRDLMRIVESAAPVR